jgi:hypothetical protein
MDLLDGSFSFKSFILPITWGWDREERGQTKEDRRRSRNCGDGVEANALTE